MREAVTGGATRVPMERIGTVANLITLVRTVLGVSFGLIALAQLSMAWLVAAYLTYWAGDVADGIVARRRGEETVIGAVFDVICDRACTTVAAAAFVALEPQVALPIALFLLQFCVVDTMLTLAFLYYPGVISPNYFYRVDRPIYRWNWSPAAKAANTSVVVLLCLLGQIWLAASWAAAMAVLKVLSLRRLHAIRSGHLAAAPRPAGVRGSVILG
mgnify:CR=1 FL=1